MFYPVLGVLISTLVQGAILYKRDDDYVPVYMPMDSVSVADTTDFGNLTVVDDSSSIEHLILTTKNILTLYNSSNSVQIEGDVQTSPDNMLNRF